MKKKIVVPIVIVVVLAAAGIGLWRWLYFGSLSQAKISVFNKTSLPAAFVGSQAIPVKQMLDFQTLATTVAGGQNSQAPGRSQILNRLIANVQASVIAKTQGATITNADLNDEYQLVIKQSGMNQAEFEKTVSVNYKITAAQFKAQILSPSVQETKINIWYNANRSLNQKTYDTLDSIQQKLKNGENFASLADQFSQDTNTKQFHGDAGTVEVNGLLPELQKGLADAQKDQVILVPTRYGLHLLKVVDTDNQGTGGSKRLHLQQIFLATDGYDAWFQAHVKAIKVRRLLHNI